MASTTTSSESLLSPYEIIFSCSVCQATITDIYRMPEGDQGFTSINSDGSEKERLVTKLWITECTHLTCGVHLEGGGVPFHPEGEKPRASCPLCVLERGDSTPKLLYGVISQAEGEHDPEIPADFFQTPPAKLGGQSPGSAALRFQYLALMRYGVMMHRRYWDTKAATLTAEKKTRKIARAAQELKEEVKSLRDRVAGLEVVETSYLKWKKKEPEVRHYLKSFAGMANENELLKRQLVALGYEVPKTVWSIKSLTEGERCGETANAEQEEKATAHSRDLHHSSSSSRKRTRNEFEAQRTRLAREQEDRGLMPPPRFPSQQDSGRGVQEEPIEPTRDTLRYQQAEQSQSHARDPEPEVQIYTDGGWQYSPRRKENPERPEFRRGDQYMMSGALPGPSRRREYPDQQAFLKPSKVSRQLGPPPRNNTFLQPLQRRNDVPSQHRQPRDSQYNPRDFESAPLDGKYLVPAAEVRVPVRTISRASFIPQPLVVERESRAVKCPPRDSGYFSNSDLRAHRQQDEEVYYADPRTPARPHVGAPQPLRVPLESPFFIRTDHKSRDMQTPVRAQNHFQPEELVSGARHYRMAPVSPVDAVGKSLNSLSFINSPYTNGNQPIYSRQIPAQPRPFSVAHHRGPELAETEYFSRCEERPPPVQYAGANSRTSLMSRNISHPPPQTSAVPSRGGKIFTRDDDLRLLSTIRGAKSGNSVAEYSYGRPVGSKPPPPVVPFSRNIATATRLFSSGGRRTVRR